MSGWTTFHPGQQFHASAESAYPNVNPYMYGYPPIEHQYTFQDVDYLQSFPDFTYDATKSASEAPNLDVRMKNLEDVLDDIRRELNERNRIYREIELYMKKIMDWTQEMKALSEQLAEDVRSIKK